MIFKTILIGLGKIGFGYDKKAFNKLSYIRTHSKALIKHKNFKLVAGVDINLKKRKEFSKILNIPTFKKYSDALMHYNPDFVIISTPTRDHYKCFCEIIKLSNPKMILFEKPVSYNYSEFLKIYSYSKKNNMKIFVNYFRVYDKGFLNLKKSFKAKNFLNKKNRGYVIYSKNLIHSGSHFLNLIEYLFEDKIYNIKVLKKYYSKNNQDSAFDLKFNIKNSEFYFFSNRDLKNEYNFFHIANSSDNYNYFNEMNLIAHTSKKNSKVNLMTNNLNIYQYNVLDNIKKNMIKNKFNEVCEIDDLLNISKIFNKIVE